MNSSDVIAPEIPRLTYRPRLTRKSTATVLWCEEWRRHGVAFSHGLAFWIWLFLIPGATTQLELVFPFSVFWIGLVGWRVGGYDLGQGVEPLVRTLASPLMTRWIIRAGVVVAAGLSFYILGHVACEWRWANRLWGFMAEGPFNGDLHAGRAPFDLLEALPIICAVGLSTFAFTSRFNGVGPSILILLFLLIVVIGVTGMTGEPPFVWLGQFLLRHDNIHRFGGFRITPEQVKLMLGLTALVWSGLIIFLGGLWYARRAPIKTSGRATELRWQWLPTAFLAVLVACWGVAGTLHFNPVDDAPGWRSRAGVWLWFVTAVQLSLFGLWLFRAKPWRERPHPTLARTRATSWVRNALVIICLGVIGWSVRTQATRHLNGVSGTWPAPLSDPVVTSNLSWDEAAAKAQGTIDMDPFNAFNVVAWIAYEAQPNHPLVTGEVVLEVPAKGAVTESMVTLELPGSLRTSMAPTVVVQVKLDWTNLSEPPANGLGRIRRKPGLKWSVKPLAPPAVGARWTATAAGEDVAQWRGPFRLEKELVFPERDRPQLVAGLLLIPQRRGETQQVRLWGDFFSESALALPEISPLPDRDSSPGGLLGMWIDYAEPLGLRDVRLPLFILLTLVAASWRYWLLGGVAVVGVFLMTLLAADTSLHHELQRIVENRGLPVPQRLEAQQISRASYFHGAVQEPVRR